ncbi:hypothetical protein [Campylobacter magnus]|uniref:hypothetical protein n=1 Tax=Campylobacter magnus TaxID=3026462 RepID=UPI0023618B7B|nr:hypothetical protein [Campylobacter magnus]MDD0856608.1 hypothetical protein [Campylobacter magnus]
MLRIKNLLRLFGAFYQSSLVLRLRRTPSPSHSQTLTLAKIPQKCLQVYLLQDNYLLNLWLLTLTN